RTRGCRDHRQRSGSVAVAASSRVLAGKGKAEPERRTDTLLALEPHLAAVADDELVRQVQPDAEARRVLVARSSVRPVEALEDTRLLVAWNADAPVAYRH